MRITSFPPVPRTSSGNSPSQPPIPGRKGCDHPPPGPNRGNILMNFALIIVAIVHGKQRRSNPTAVDKLSAEKFPFSRNRAKKNRDSLAEKFPGWARRKSAAIIGKSKAEKHFIPGNKTIIPGKHPNQAQCCKNCIKPIKWNLPGFYKNLTPPLRKIP